MYSFSFHLTSIAFVAQGLEHWSCKPGVESSNLSEGFCCRVSGVSRKDCIPVNLRTQRVALA